MKKSYRLALSLAVVALSFGLLIRYCLQHPEIFDQLGSVSPLYVGLIALLYLGVILSLTLMNTHMVALFKKRISPRDSFSITSASSMVNFFGPLQGGIGVRGVYLKKNHGINFKHYGLTMLYYYAIYCVISGLFLLFGSARWRLPLIGVLVVSSLVVIWWLKRKTTATGSTAVVNASWLGKLAALTLLQLLLLVGIYYTELTALDQQVSIAQAISYTGAANLSLFVAFTPGGIGIREAFLVFSQQLHQVDGQTIIAANVLDRSIYAVFLGVLFVVLLATHSKAGFEKLRSPKSQL